MAGIGIPRTIRIDEPIYIELMRTVAARKTKGEDIDITKLINELLYLQMPVSIWDSIDKRLISVEQQVQAISDKLSATT